MNKKWKIAIGFSMLFNVLFIIGALLVPQYRMIGSYNIVHSDNNFQVGGYVNGLNFETPGVDWLEYYLIFGIPGKSWDGTGSYFYMNGVTTNSMGSWLPNTLEKLEIKTITDAKIELFNDTYLFEINKKSGNVIGKDKNGKIFELKNMKKTYGYEWLLK